MAEETWGSTFRDVLLKEIREGGELKHLPCPFCKLPRCQRSDYIRCSRCGINWLDGEDTSKDPRVGRFRAMVESAQKSGGGER